MPMPHKLREIATAALEQLPDEVRSRLEADAAEIPHRALRRAFLRTRRLYACPVPCKGDLTCRP